MDKSTAQEIITVNKVTYEFGLDGEFLMKIYNHTYEGFKKHENHFKPQIFYFGKSGNLYLDNSYKRKYHAMSDSNKKNFVNKIQTKFNITINKII